VTGIVPQISVQQSIGWYKAARRERAMFTVVVVRDCRPPCGRFNRNALSIVFEARWRPRLLWAVSFAVMTSMVMGTDWQATFAREFAKAT
jgi:hypothetical protein